MVIHPYVILGIPISKSKDDLAQKTIYFENLILNFETKNECHTEVMNICDTSPYGDTLMCHIWYDYVKG